MPTDRQLALETIKLFRFVFFSEIPSQTLF